MKQVYSKEVKIGIAAIVCLVLLYVGIEFLKGVNIFKPGNYYTVTYSNVTGLAVSSPVTINGFSVGLVRDISYDYESNNGCMKVVLSLDKNIRLAKGTKALLCSDLLGTAGVQLKLSDTTADGYYKSGDELPGEIVLGLMDNVSAKLMPAVDQLLPKLDSILTNVNTLTSNQALNNAVTRMDIISKNLEQTTASINKLMAGQVPATMNNVSAISENLVKVSSDVAELTTTLKALPIDSTVNHLNSTLANVEHISNQLSSENSSVGMLINSRGLYDHLDNTISDLDSILVDLRYNPKKYVNFKLF